MNKAVFEEGYEPKNMTLPINKWIVTNLSQAVKKIAKDIDGYAFNEASEAAYHFVWGTFCDQYLEAIKSIFYGDDEAAKQETRLVLGFVVNAMLKMLHPFMPFVTEELWRKTADRKEMLMVQKWPKLEAYEDKSAEADVDWLFALIASVRSTRVSINIPASAKISLKIKDATEGQRRIITAGQAILKTLARVESLEFVESSVHGAVTQVLDGMVYMIPLQGCIDVEAEKARLVKNKESLIGFIERMEAQLSNQDFISKAPEKVISDKRQLLEKNKEDLAKIENTLVLLSGSEN